MSFPTRQVPYVPVPVFGAVTTKPGRKIRRNCWAGITNVERVFASPQNRSKNLRIFYAKGSVAMAEGLVRSTGLFSSAPRGPGTQGVVKTVAVAFHLAPLASIARFCKLLKTRGNL